ncbi:cysteine hydrolase family protein [Micromonospora rubida]
MTDPNPAPTPDPTLGNRRRPTVLGTLPEKVRPDRAALLIIDMSNDFLHPAGKTIVRGGRDASAARAVVPVQRQLIDAAHTAGVPVIYVSHTTLPNHASDSGPWLDARSRASFSVVDICVDGSWGQQVIDELTPTEDDILVKKYRYSGFAGTNLDLVLRSLARSTVICAGVSTNACVEATAREAFSHDYYVVIPEDACASWDMELHQATLDTARHRYATVGPAADIIEIWSSTEERR